MERLYTIQEANAVVDRIRPWLLDLQQIVARLDELRAQLGGIDQKARLNGRAHEAAHLTADVDALTQQAQRIVSDLTSLGIELKDPHQGLIDFRALRDGRVVYLCWRLGEGRIAFWHHLDAGFAGRQPLDE